MKLSKNEAASSHSTEDQLRRIWAELLNLDAGQISPEDDFFDLGGDSFSLTMLCARIEFDLKVELPVDLCAEKPTIAAIAAHLRAERHERS